MNNSKNINSKALSIKRNRRSFLFKNISIKTSSNFEFPYKYSTRNTLENSNFSIICTT